jgi:AraC family transcriptional regulator
MSVDDHWHPLLVRSRVEPDRQDYLFLPGTPDPWLVVMRTGTRSIEVKKSGRWYGGHSSTGQVAVTSPGSTTEVRWRNEGVDPIETLHICIDADFLTKMAAEVSDGSTQTPEVLNVLAQSDPVAAHVGATLHRELAGGPTTCTKLFVDGASQMLAAHILRHYCVTSIAGRTAVSTFSPRKFQKLREYIDENLAKPLGLDELAAELGMSTYHFARIFKRSFGETPHGYVTRIKMERAKTLLLEKQWTVQRIARRLGFSSASHFSVRFQQQVGLSPREFRRIRSM